MMPLIAKRVAQFLDQKLSNNSIVWKNLTIVGYSLGAQMAGFIGKQVKKGTVGTIFGLDPAGLLSSNCCLGNNVF